VNAILAHELILSIVRQNCFQFGLDAGAVLLMHARKPFLGRVLNVLILTAKHGFPVGRVFNSFRGDVPIPKALVVSSGSESEALLALANGFFRPLAV
jgi:hypothetical protein